MQALLDEVREDATRAWIPNRVFMSYNRCERMCILVNRIRQIIPVMDYIPGQNRDGGIIALRSKSPQYPLRY